MLVAIQHAQIWDNIADIQRNASPEAHGKGYTHIEFKMLICVFFFLCSSFAKSHAFLSHIFAALYVHTLLTFDMFGV